MSTLCVSGSQVNSVNARQFKQRRFERRTSTESGLFALLSCDFEQALRQNVFLTVKTFSNINLVVSNKKRKRLTSWWRSSLQNVAALNLINGAYSIWFLSSDVGKIFWSWILKDCIKVQEKKKNVVPCFRPRQKVKLGTHVVVVPRRQRNAQKSVMRVQSCYFANITLFLFCRSSCHCRRCCLSSIIRARLCERCSQLLAWAKGQRFSHINILLSWLAWEGDPFSRHNFFSPFFKLVIQTW